MTERITAPNIVATGSSVRGQNSYSHVHDYQLGMPVNDKFTHLTMSYAEKLTPTSTASLPDLFTTYSYTNLESTFNYRTIELRRPLESWRLTDFFSSVAAVYPVPEVYPLNGSEHGGQDQDQDQGQGQGDSATQQGLSKSELWALHAGAGIA
jgi:GPI-anchor transamidase subunit K